ncbi:MAG TPA: outer-membrane lipoprotein carrier protein LolA [Melioribacteraceae bacterium]|nr:outer-membrane lipoprotein carrier protein LolA [Melioribacteraceae bacterium]
MKKLLLFILFPFILFAQNPYTILKQLQNKVKETAGFSCNFKQSFADNIKKKSSLSGKFIFAYGDKYIVETKNFKIISDGISVWNYSANQKRVIISSANEEASSFSIDRYLFKVPELCKLTVIKDEKFPNSIKLIPKGYDLEFSSAEVYSDENYFIRKVIITDTNDVTYILELNDNKIITDLSQYKFTFSPPKGVKVVDMR